MRERLDVFNYAFLGKVLGWKKENQGKFLIFVFTM